jgi:hypothetical protein
VKASKAQMILIAGPYRSGTNDAPALIKKNVRQREIYESAEDIRGMERH